MASRSGLDIHSLREKRNRRALLEPLTQSTRFDGLDECDTTEPSDAV
jgi:hypothetical protein